jgi:hypothetical protein
LLGEDAGEVLFPDPSYGGCGIVLVLRKPELAFRAHDIKHLVKLASVRAKNE